MKPVTLCFLLGLACGSIVAFTCTRMADELQQGEEAARQDRDIAAAWKRCDTAAEAVHAAESWRVVAQVCLAYSTAKEIRFDSGRLSDSPVGRVKAVRFRDGRLVAARLRGAARNPPVRVTDEAAR